jgi:hypothetical protein
MSQVSRPLQVLLLLVIAFGAVWFIALRPKAAEEEPPPDPAPAAQPADAGGAPATSAPGRVVEKAREADRTSQERRRRSEATADAQESAPSAPVPDAAAPPPAPGVPSEPKQIGGVDTLPGPARAALSDGKVLVLLFWNPRSADDRAVRAAVRGLGNWSGNVTVVSEPVRRLSRYEAISRSVPIVSSPTIVVVDGRRRARTITGFVDEVAVQEAVLDAMSARR